MTAEEETRPDDGSDDDESSVPEGRPSEPPVDGPGTSDSDEDPGATSYDQPGGSEHGV